MSITLRRRTVLAGLAATALPAPALAQADSRPSIAIAVQQIVNAAALDPLREQSNIGERIFLSFMETDDGRTLGDRVIPMLEAGRLALPEKTG